MAFCTECGTKVPDGIKFCTACGNPMSEAPKPVPVMGTTPMPVPAPAPISAPAPVPAATPTPAKPTKAVGVPPKQIPVSDAPERGSRYAVMGTGAYIGYSILFSIPAVGWIACLIMAFAAKNLNTRNYARAMLIFLIIGIVISVALYFLFSWISEAAIQYINETTNGVFGDLSGANGLFDMFAQIGNSMA